VVAPTSLSPSIFYNNFVVQIEVPPPFLSLIWGICGWISQYAAAWKCSHQRCSRSRSG
jgi:hypothetical protein